MSREDTKIGQVLVVAGPTASGKSALALEIAKRLDGTVINADSMQVYRDLCILTDRPREKEISAVPHKLYGILDAAERGSVAWWRQQALQAIRETLREGRLPILCGGTGLYLRAMMEGIADIPTVPDEVVKQAEELYRELGGAEFRKRLYELDPGTAARLHDGDSQRLQRAWAVATATGQPLSHWIEQGQAPEGDLAFKSVLIVPEALVSADAIERRFRDMIAQGALDEVRALKERGLSPGLPAMRALGVSQLIDFIDEAISLDTAVDLSVVATRQFAKRQRTWFRNQFIADVLLVEKFSNNKIDKIFPKIREWLLTPDS